LPDRGSRGILVLLKRPAVLSKRFWNQVAWTMRSGETKVRVEPRCSSRLTRRCSEPPHHKVLGRGRVGTAPLRAPSARVLGRTRAVAELGS